MRVNPVSTVAFEECYCLIWESGIIGQPCEWGPVEQWGRDPSPNLINTLWAENKSVIWPAFNAHWLTVYSALLPVKYPFMSGEGNRVSGRKIQRKATVKRDGTVRRPPLHSCVWRKRGMLCSCGECWVWAMTYWHLILPEFHLTHVLLSDTLSSYRSWPQSHSCFLWSDTPLLLSAIKPNHTHVCSLHAVHTLTHIYPSLLNIYYPVSFFKLHVNLKITCSC